MRSLLPPRELGRVSAAVFPVKTRPFFCVRVFTMAALLLCRVASRKLDTSRGGGGVTAPVLPRRSEERG